MDDDRSRGLFLEIYGTLPRAGPGGDDHTRRALGLAGAAAQSVLDLGCGPGQQTVVLAEALPEATVLAVDLLPSMVDEANRRLDDAGLSGRASAVCGDMATPPIDPASQDLIWAEGSIYNLGVTDALRAWEPLLSAGGRVAFTEPIWLVDEPAEEIADWWLAEYPPMSGVEAVRARIAAAGFETVADFVLPANAWTDEYYDPMAQRIDEMVERHPGDALATEIAAMAQHEIDMFRRFSDTYSYAFFIAEPEAAG